jgi:hypothetical protein
MSLLGTPGTMTRALMLRSESMCPELDPLDCKGVPNRCTTRQTLNKQELAMGLTCIIQGVHPCLMRLAVPSAQITYPAHPGGPAPPAVRLTGAAAYPWSIQRLRPNL